MSPRKLLHFCMPFGSLWVSLNIFDLGGKSLYGILSLSLQAIYNIKYVA